MRGLFLRVFPVTCVAAFFFYLLFRVLLLTPISATAIEKFFSEFTGRTVSVGGLFLSGGTVFLERIAMENPPGFQERGFLSVRSISVTPDLLAFLAGKKAFSSIRINGLRINLAKDSAGAWNVSGLLDRITAKKSKKSGETFIGLLHIRDASLRINGYGFQRIGLVVENLSTSGTSDSKIEISAADQAGNPVSLLAEGSLGNDPSFRITMNMPTLSLSPLLTSGRGSRLFAPGAVTAGVALSADFRHGVLRSRGNCAFERLGLNIGGDVVPIRASLDFAGRWDTRRDEAFLERATLSANDDVTVRASGSIRRITRDGAFSLKFLPDPVEIGSVARIFPEKLRRGFMLDGTLTSSGGYLEGNRREGIVGGKGNFSIRSSSLAVGGRTLIRGAGADIACVGDGGGWLVSGRVFAGKSVGSPLLESLEAPFRVSFSPRFTPVRMEMTAVRAVVLGIPLVGGLRYTPSRTEPYSIECSADGASLAALNSRVPRAAVRFTSGTGKATVRFSGVSVRDFTGSVTAAVSSPAGTFAGERFSLKSGRFTSAVRGSGGSVTAEGVLQLIEGMARGKKLGASLEYSFVNEVLAVRNADLFWGGTKVEIASVTLRVPSAQERGGQSGFPLVGAFAGAGIRNGDVSLAGIAGRIDSRFFSGGPKPRLEGTAHVTLQSVSFLGQRAASLAGRIHVTGSGATATITGESLGGKLDATVQGDIFSPERAATFSLRLQDQRLDVVQRFLPTGTQPRLAGGSASVSLSGTYARQTGIQGTLSAAGSGISLAGEGGRILVPDVGVTIDSRIDGENLSVRQAVVVQGQGVTTRVAGTMQRFASADRTGSFTFVLPTVPVNSLLDAFANVLPRNLQEAVCEGSCSLEGGAEIAGREIRIRGDLVFDAASLEIPSQKVYVTGVRGTVPLSLYLPGTSVQRAPSSTSFSRDNFPKLLQTLGRTAKSGAGLSIGMLRFGALESGPFTLHMSAERGMLEIVSIEGALYEGKLLGSGFLRFGRGFEYGADFLVSDLSLKQFCESFPAIKGYITGRVDGVISLLNVKGGLGGLAGYVDLWTRSGKGEKMSVSKEFLQKLAGRKLRGFLFTNDRAYDTGEISAYLRSGFLTFEKLDISHTNLLGMKDLSVTVVPVQNRISLEHLMDSIREAAARGKAGGAGEAPIQTDLKWLE